MNVKSQIANPPIGLNFIKIIQMKEIKVCVLFALFSLIFSCKKEDADYQIINDFIGINYKEI